MRRVLLFNRSRRFLIVIMRAIAIKRPAATIAFSLWACISASALAEDPRGSEYVLDPFTGEIAGKVAVVVYPVTYSNSKVDEILNPAGFEAHLTQHDDHPELELIYPCGAWFQPPARHRYRVWVEGNGLMSPYSSMLIYGGGVFKGRGLSAALPVVEAGRVVLPGDLEGSDNLELRLLRADHLEGNLVRWELSRRRSTTQIDGGLLMPRGPAIGGLWDRRRQSYVALSRPFEVKPGKTVEVPLERPEDVAHLVVQVQRRSAVPSVDDDDYDVEFTLARPGIAIAPDLKIPTATAVYALWYDIEPGPAELQAGSKSDFLDPQSVELLPGMIERVSGILKERPALDVEIELPAAMEDDDELSVELRRLPDEEKVAGHILAHGVRFVRFEKLAPALFEIVLQSSVGSFSRQVDLSDGKDGFVLLAPELIVLSGTVFRGSDGHPARLSLHTVGRTTAEAHADDRGAYGPEFRYITSTDWRLCRAQAHTAGRKSRRKC